MKRSVRRYGMQRTFGVHRREEEPLLSSEGLSIWTPERIGLCSLSMIKGTGLDSAG
jgi:hypothetical protein